MVEVAFDTAKKAVESLNENVQQTDNEPIGMDELLQKNEVRQEQVREKTEEMESAETEEQLNKPSSEIRELNSEFFEEMDRIETDTSQNQDTRRRTDYDSEVGC